MRLLLDTHVLLWWLADDRKLTKIARAVIANPSNEVLVSSVSLWEIAIKASLGRIEVELDDLGSGDCTEWLPALADRLSPRSDSRPSAHCTSRSVRSDARRASERRGTAPNRAGISRTAAAVSRLRRRGRCRILGLSPVRSSPRRRVPELWPRAGARLGLLSFLREAR